MTPPLPTAPRPYAFPKPVKRQLANGLTVFVVEDHRLPVVTFALEILAGNCSVAPGKSGLPSLTAGLLREGAGVRTSPEISSLVDGCGGSMGASAGDDVTTAGGTFMKSYATLGLELLADIVQRPRFDQEEIDRRLEQIQSGLAVNLNDPAYLISLVSARTILGDHPYAYPGDGTPETIAGLKREDITGFWKSHYVPDATWFTISGDVTSEEGFAMAEQAFGGWKGAGAAVATLLPAPPPRARKVLIVDMPQTVQTQIVIGHTGIPRKHPDFLALNVANQIFGGSFNSRLNMKIRAKEGLTYDASSGFEAQRQAGSFTVGTFTRTEKTAEAVRMIVDLLNEFKANPATPEEFDEAKAFLHGSFALATETSGQIADRVLSAALHDLGDDYWTGYRARLEALTIEQVRSAVQRLLEPDKLAIVAVGDAKAFSKELAAYGPVTVIPQPELDLVAPGLRKPRPVSALL
ncbi:MAG: pitrilysin family protein [Bryobacteraceae bacterium]|nr:pitrilysin family protein [Bryobacteraceae bacterium]